MHIQIKNVSFTYDSKVSPKWRALTDVSVDIPPNSMLAIVGAAGSGKTTLIQMMNGLLRPTKGQVIIDSNNLRDKKTNLIQIREMIGMVFQFPEMQLFEETVFDDVAFGPRQLGCSHTEIQQRVLRALQLVHLNVKRFGHLSPFHLSGGEQRKVAIAGVLAVQPKVLILDEPTVGLDQKSRDAIENLMKEYHESGKSVIFISHDMDQVGRLAERVVVLARGTLVYDGLKDSLFQDRKLLDQNGLVMPKISQFLVDIEEKNISVPKNIYHMKEAKEAIKKALRKN